MRYLLIVSAAAVLLAGCARPDTLAGTRWSADFYHYHNLYVFETDSTGYSMDGQRAWSMPPLPGIPEDSVLYNDKQPFRYELTPHALTIEHTARLDKRVFTRKGKREDTRFFSTYEYVYGREVLSIEQ